MWHTDCWDNSTLQFLRSEKWFLFIVLLRWRWWSALPPSVSLSRPLHAAPLYVLMMPHLCFLAWHLRLHVLSELSRPAARPALTIYVSDTFMYIVVKAPNFPVVLDTSFPLAPHISSSCGFFLQHILYPGTVPCPLHRHHPNSQDPSSPLWTAATDSNWSSCFLPFPKNLFWGNSFKDIHPITSPSCIKTLQCLSIAFTMNSELLTVAQAPSAAALPASQHGSHHVLTAASFSIFDYTELIPTSALLHWPCLGRERCPHHCWALLTSQVTSSKSPFFPFQVCRLFQSRFYKQCQESFWLFRCINELPAQNILLKWGSWREVNKGTIYKDLGK